MSSLPSYARSLNEQQRRAALAPIDAPLLVLAGAGSGKTGVMAARVQHILASGVPPASVLTLTFTRAAETAIRERLTASVGVRVAKALRVATFHSLALSICREFAAALEGGTADFAIVTGAQQARLVARALVEYRIARAARPPSSSSSSGSSSPDPPDASRARCALLHAKARGGRAEGVADEALRFVWDKYEAWQREPRSPQISPYLPISPRISPYLPISPRTRRGSASETPSTWLTSSGSPRRWFGRCRRRAASCANGTATSWWHCAPGARRGGVDGVSSQLRP